MKKVLCLGLLSSLITTNLFADLRMPEPEARNFTEINVTGNDARDLSNSLKVESVIEYALRGGATNNVKIFRSGSELLDITCHETKRGLTPDSDVNKTTYKCSIKQSTNGKKVPKYVLRRILG